MAENDARPLPPAKQAAARPSFLAGLNALETIIVAVIALVALAGLLMIAKGLILKSDGAFFSAGRPVWEQSGTTA
ncbi:hypothetical protein BTR14_03940 [Rhizobium rhizosphaerae]|uniref:Uncharacterized protein n=1 Tax=Xaviernesmea rhizosphaerae TaxID=1672749 RepID=A0ABX3PIJ0_9HYPH|nr:hypothetical protein [Xaviernesmea rhizosphaerae]OQP87724.1 hypothetical protein BTR14_03940 [Xaviernesmea rhizosphaerae]